VKVKVMDKVIVKKFTVVFPKEGYRLIKEKAKRADMSLSKFLTRAGSIISVKEIIEAPLHNYGQSDS